ncbi:cytochrome c oxidase subunit II [Candidatus Hodarchaeum mangrovi]
MRNNYIVKFLSLGGFFYVVTNLVSKTIGQGGSQYTPQLESLFAVVLFFSLLIAGIVYGLMTYILVRFRAGSKTIRKLIQNETRIELAWILFAAIIVVILFISSLPVTTSYLTDQEYDEEILVVGYQYYFQFYNKQTGNATTNIVYLQVNKSYKLNLTSTDVIHSFYCHELSIKLDMIPGRFNIIYLKVSTPGSYAVHCAEYCGFGHYTMEATIIVS